MRCPECEIRNSVAARKCVECGHQFKKKPLPLPLIIGAAGVLAVGSLGAWAVTTAFTQKDPASGLSAVAKRVAAGPKSAEDASKLKEELDNAVRDYLRKAGNKPAEELRSKMQAALPSAFEVHVFDLPRGLKIVEVDTVLQATEHLVIETPHETKAITLPGPEVFEAARIINDPTGPVLVILGHSSGQTPKRPQLRVFALMPDDVHDQSEKSVPPFYGEGTAKFAKNERDIAVEVSQYSAGAHQNLFNPETTANAHVPDETIKHYLEWSQGKYTIKRGTARGYIGSLYAVAHSLHSEGEQKAYKNYFTPASEKQLETARAGLGTVNVGFNLARMKDAQGSSRRQRQKPVFGMYSGDKGVTVTLARGSAGAPAWIIESIASAPAKSIVANMVPLPKSPSPSRLVPQSVLKQVSASGSGEHGSGSGAHGSGSGAHGSGSGAAQQGAAPIVERIAPGSKTGLQTAAGQHSVKPLEPEVTQTGQEAAARRAQEAAAKAQAAREAAAKVQAAREAAAKEAAAKESAAKEAARKAAQEQARKAQQASAGSAQHSSAYVTTQSDPNVKVRKGPSTGYRTILQLDRGDRVEVLGKQNDWYKVRANGREGYVHETLITHEKPAPLQINQTPVAPQPVAQRSTTTQRSSSSQRRNERSRTTQRAQRPPQAAKQPAQPEIEEPPFVP